MNLIDAVADIAPTLAKLQTEMEKRGWSVAVKPNNRFAEPTRLGYRDFKLNLRAPDGQICELQINTKAMFAAKELDGHKLYEETRPLAEGLASGSIMLNPDVMPQVKSLEEQQKRVYNEAWRLSGGS